MISERIFVRRLARRSLHSGPKLAVLLMHLEFDRVVLGGSERVEHNCSELTAFKVAFGRFERQVSKFFLTKGGRLTTAWDEEHLQLQDWIGYLPNHLNITHTEGPEAGDDLLLAGELSVAKERFEDFPTRNHA